MKVSALIENLTELKDENRGDFDVVVKIGNEWYRLSSITVYDDFITLE